MLKCVSLNKRLTYVGYTNNLKQRILLHNSNKGAKFTKGKKWKLIYSKNENKQKKINWNVIKL